LAGLEAKSVRKKFKEKSFAAAVNREQISQCSQIGLEFDEFIELGLKAMQGIAADLGL
jgi:Predicted hydrolase (HD superfamily)